MTNALERTCHRCGGEPRTPVRAATLKDGRECEFWTCPHGHLNIEAGWTTGPVSEHLAETRLRSQISEAVKREIDAERKQ